MSTASPAAPVSLVQRLRGWLATREWRLPPIDTYPTVVAFAQTLAGKLVLFVLFAVVMKLISPGVWIEERYMWLLMTLGAAAVSLAGRYRHFALLACTASLLAIVPSWFDFSAVQLTIKQEGVSGLVNVTYLRAATLVACVPITVAAIYLARHYRDHPLGRRPVLAQHVLYFLLLGCVTTHWLHGLPQVLLWSVISTFSAYFWFLAYALIDQRHRQPAPMHLQLASFSPFFASTIIPMGAGAANWRRVEASTAQELAVTQLKALKLLVWAYLLKQFLLVVIRLGVYEKLGVTPLKLLFERFVKDGHVATLSALNSILVNFPERLLVVAVGGHIIIATARLAGFRLLRNTYRPLSARTIAEFWNRYVYYFKEILVHVYFYPTYVRYFKRHPRLRLAFATFMAAGVGNFIFHFMENYHVVKLGLLNALVRGQTYAFYCALLVTGIVISQLRARRPNPNAGWLREHFVPFLGVATFYCFLSIFDGPQRHVTLAQHFAFLLQVFGIDRWINMTW